MNQTDRDALIAEFERQLIDWDGKALPDAATTLTDIHCGRLRALISLASPSLAQWPEDVVERFDRLLSPHAWEVHDDNRACNDPDGRDSAADWYTRRIKTVRAALAALPPAQTEEPISSAAQNPVGTTGDGTTPQPGEGRAGSPAQQWPEDAVERALAVFSENHRLGYPSSYRAAIRAALATLPPPEDERVKGLDDIRDLIVAAYEAGAMAVQENYRPLREGEDPEFGEAACDYADSALASYRGGA